MMTTLLPLSCFIIIISLFISNDSASFCGIFSYDNYLPKCLVKPIMFKLLLILFAIKLYARINVYKLIQQKHGQAIIKKVRNYVKLKTKLTKLKADIVYIKSFKKEDLIPAFAKVNLSIKSGGYKLKKKLRNK